MKKLYGIMAIVGFVLPLSQFIQWLNQNGIDIFLLISSITEDKLSLFAWLDVLISAVVLIIFIVYEGRKQSMRRLWMPIAGTLCVGVSFGLPLFLFLREIHFEQTTLQH